MALEGLGALAAPLLASAARHPLGTCLAGLPLPAVVLTGRKLVHSLDATAGERAHVLVLAPWRAFLEPLDMAALESLAGRVVRMQVPPGDRCRRQGEPVTASTWLTPGPRTSSLTDSLSARWGRADYFGERALLRSAPRMATVRSRETMELLALPRDDFVTALTGLATAASDRRRCSHPPSVL